MTFVRMGRTPDERPAQPDDGHDGEEQVELAEGDAHEDRRNDEEDDRVAAGEPQERGRN